MKLMWVDDEIEGLKPHILFLKKEGIEVYAFDRPREAIEALKETSFDLILLDYRMPGLNGLDTLREMKKIAPQVPIALVTMVSDREVIEESVTEDVFDYILKPIQPSQILALVKRIEANKLKERYKGKKLVALYQRINTLPETYEGWLEKAKIFAEIMAKEELEEWEEELKAQNAEFARWVNREYKDLVHNKKLTWSYNLLTKHVFPELKAGKKVAFFLFDNFRADQFYRFIYTLPPAIRIEIEPYMAILPTATPFARNAIFAGKLPVEIEKEHPGWTLNNLHERELLVELLEKEGLSRIRTYLYKINSLKFFREIKSGEYQFEAYSINFIDLLSHLRQEIESLKDLTPDRESFIKWTEYVLESAKIRERIKELLDKGFTVFLTTDHGWVEGKEPLIVLGGGELTPGLRFKFGDSVRARGRGGFLWTRLKDYGLPENRGKRLLLATEYHYFVYPSDVRRFEKTYYGGIYHGGITLEEQCLFLIKLEA